MTHDSPETPLSVDSDLMRRLEEDLLDGYDEELELELEDRPADALSPQEDGPDEAQRLPRLTYFRELFRLQGELVKLQDWVAHTGEKVVIVFEGRDAAGKGGVIKRITQRLNCIAPLLSLMACEKVAKPAVELRERVRHPDYIRQPVTAEVMVPELY